MSNVKAIECDVACLCGLCLAWPNGQKVEPSYPQHRITRQGQHVLVCPRCFFYTGPSENPQATLTWWALSNKPGNAHVAELWLKEYQYQQDEARRRQSA